MKDTVKEMVKRDVENSFYKFLMGLSILNNTKNFSFKFKERSSDKKEE